MTSLFLLLCNLIKFKSKIIFLRMPILIYDMVTFKNQIKARIATWQWVIKSTLYISM
jgi:hypothetical protein